MALTHLLIGRTIFDLSSREELFCRPTGRHAKEGAMLQGWMMAWSRIPERFCHFVVVLGAVCAILTAGRPARAQMDAPGQYALYGVSNIHGGPKCVLPFSPFVHETATPADVACSLDADDDGLNDEIEGFVAGCFAPALRFDGAEKARRHGLTDCEIGDAPCLPDGTEPLTVFRVDPDPKGKEAFLQYLFIFNRDGGFYKVKVDTTITLATPTLLRCA
jgi:hypothetical protein